MSVVMVLSNPEPSLGGTTKQAFALAGELRSRGVPVSIVSKREQRPKEAPWKHASAPSAAAVPSTMGVRRLPTLRIQPAWSFLVSFLLWAGLNRRRFQVIHAHNAPLGVIACVVGWLTGKKVVVKVPGDKYVEYLQGHRPARRLRRWILRRKADRFVAVSTDMARALRESGIPPGKIEVIPNGIALGSTDGGGSPEAHKRAWLGSAGRQVVLFAGRFVEEKGLDRLLGVWAAMPPRNDVVLVLVGDGPLKREMEARARALPRTPVVRFLGHQPDVSPFYAMADVFVMPSRSEGTSNALLEAMAAGLAVVVSAAGGNKDIVEEGRSGIVIDWDDPAGAAAVLQRLLADGDLRGRLGRGARERAARFAMDGVAERYHRLYRAVLSEPRA